ncbi:hypothetical protein ACFSTC_18130 [Nonomuraea ferruginea]
MCGIVAYVGPKDAAPILLEGLQRLEYRGYDSAGIVVSSKGLKVRKVKGRVADLAKVVLSQVQGRSRHRPHPVGDARRAQRRERASAPVGR